MNGRKKFRINENPIYFIPEDTYFKYGIYRSFISRYKKMKKTNALPTQVVYYDEIRRGNSIEEVDFNINPQLKVID